MEFLDNLKIIIDNFLYSPLMIGVQVFSVIFSIGLIILRMKMFRETDDINRPLSEMLDSWFTRNKKNTETQNNNNRNLDGLMSKWQEIENRMNTHDEAQWKLGIIESDNLLYEALQQIGIQGDSLGEKLKSMNINHYPFINDAWKAHRVRNYLVHDSSYHLSARTVGETYNYYRNVFVDIGIVKNN